MGLFSFLDILSIFINMLNNENIKNHVKSCLFPSAGIENNFMIRDYLTNNYVPFFLFPTQKELVKAFDENRFNLVVKHRQCGSTSVTLAYLASKAAFIKDGEEPEYISIFTTSHHRAREILNTLKVFISQIPRRHWGPEYNVERKRIFTRQSSTEIGLPNGSLIRVSTASPDAVRGYTPSMVFIEDAAYMKEFPDIYSSIVTNLGRKGRMIVESIPNGQYNFFYNLYVKSINNEFSFKITEMRWYEDYRYNRDLAWFNNNGELVYEEEFTNESYQLKINNGWKPFSAWYDNMRRSMNYNEKIIAQELDCSFETP